MKFGFFYDDQEVQIIDLDSFKNLEMVKLYDEITRIRCDGKVAVLNFKGKTENKDLSAYNDCEELGCSRVNNVFFIIDNEIFEKQNVTT